jgi:hypothetical protein
VRRRNSNHVRGLVNVAYTGGAEPSGERPAKVTNDNLAGPGPTLRDPGFPDHKRTRLRCCHLGLGSLDGVGVYDLGRHDGPRIRINEDNMFVVAALPAQEGDQLSDGLVQLVLGPCLRRVGLIPEPVRNVVAQILVIHQALVAARRSHCFDHPVEPYEVAGIDLSAKVADRGASHEALESGAGDGPSCWNRAEPMQLSRAGDKSVVSSASSHSVKSPGHAHCQVAEKSVRDVIVPGILGGPRSSVHLL